MFRLPQADFDRLLQAQVLAFQDKFAECFAGCLIVLSSEKSLLSIEAPESQYQVLGENWTQIYDAARLSLGCQLVKLSPLNQISEYTELKDSEASDMNTNSARSMPGRVAIETSVQPTQQWGDTIQDGGWISFEVLANRMGRDTQEIIRMVARSRIPSFRHLETLEEGLDRRGVKQLLDALSKMIYSELDFQDMEQGADADNAVQPEPEPIVVNGSAPLMNGAPEAGATDIDAAAVETPQQPQQIELKLPTNWTPKDNPRAENFSRNPNPMTALNNALIALGVVPNSQQYWGVMERLQRRRIDKEAKSFLRDVSVFYSDSDAAFTKLREQTCKLWDEYAEKSEAASA